MNILCWLLHRGWKVHGRCIRCVASRPPIGRFVVALLALGGCAATPPPVPVSKRIPALVCTPSLYIRADGNGLRSLLCYAPDDRGRIEVFEQEIAK